MYHMLFHMRNLSDTKALVHLTFAQFMIYLRDKTGDEVSECLWFPALPSFILKVIDAAFPRYILPPLRLEIVLHTPV